jgi:transposase
MKDLGDYGWTILSGASRQDVIKRYLEDTSKHLRVLVADGLVMGDFSEHEAVNQLNVSESLVTDVVTNYVRYVKQTGTTPAHYEHRT